MSLFDKALWYIEAHSDEALELATIAKALDLSPFHLTRLFGLRTGLGLMAYHKARRLSRAAQALVERKDPIIEIALEFGYQSHESFSRAFKAQFSQTPSSVRRSGTLIHLRLQEAIMITPSAPHKPLGHSLRSEPRRMIMGLSRPYRLSDLGGIPSQWQAFMGLKAGIEAPVLGVSYGISYDFQGTDQFSYLCGIETLKADSPYEGLSVLELRASDYIVFEHRGHVSDIGASWRHIYEEGLARAGVRPAPRPAFERMDERFDRATGQGLIEIWVPLDR